MSAYIIIRVDIGDKEAYAEYMRRTPVVINRFGGRFLVRGGATETLEGEPETLRLVVVAFPSMEAAKSFYHSEEYQAVKAFREGAGAAQFVAVEGYPAEEWERVVSESEEYEAERSR